MLTYKKKFFLIYIISILIFFVLVYNLLTASNLTSVKNIVQNNLKEKTLERLEYFDDFFLPYFKSIKAINENQIFKDFINQKTNKTYLQEYFLSIKKSLPSLLQVRYLDNFGNEIIRIEGTNLIDKNPISIIVEDNKLQNKANKDYVKKFLELKKNEIGISKIDLNKEFGKIEISKKQVIRVAMRVFDNKNEKKGILVLNISLKTLFSKINKITLFNTYIIDAKGNYINHYDVKYGLLGNQNHTLYDDYPLLADEIIKNNTFINNHLYSTTIDSLNNNQGLKFILENKFISDVELANKTQNNFILTAILIAIFTLPLVFYFSRQPDDLQAQLNTKEEIEQKNIFIKTILKNAPIPMYYKNLDGIYLNVNDKFIEFFGLEDVEIINKTANDFLDTKLANTFQKKDIELLESPDKIQIYQTTIVNFKSETIYTVEFHKNILLNTKGEKIGIIGSIYNITDSINLRNELIHLNKHLNEKVKFQTNEIREKMRVITQNVLYSRTDTEGYIVDVSEAFCNLSGYSKEELIGSPHSIIRHPDTPKELFKDLWSKLKNGKSWKGEIKNRKKDGSPYWVYSDIQPKYDIKGNVKGYISVRSNITDRKIFENQQIQVFEQSKMAAMGEMIGNIAHQWRQPLSVITTIASGLAFKNELGTLKLETINKDMDTIIDSAQYLSNTIETFRNFLRENKELQIICVQDILNEVLHIVSATVKNNDITILNETTKMQKTCLNMVSGELDQVIINIINNAKDVFIEKKIEDRWIKIDLETTQTHAILSIEDNGGGIPDDVMPKIFEAYFTTKHKSKGTGLGLYMSYKIVKESLKGNMYAQNTQNGVKFFIELPINS
jgi:PAS domain S-box-containing protein